MRALIAPDSFGDTLTAVAAAEAIAKGWRHARPADEIVCAPLSDGGPGFVDVLASRLGTPMSASVTGPLGEPVQARWLLDMTTATGYIECAQACGLPLIEQLTPDSAWRATTFGVGELIAIALEAGVQRVVVGLGGSSSTDGGLGAVAALAGLSVDDVPGLSDDRVPGLSDDRVSGLSDDRVSGLSDDRVSGPPGDRAAHALQAARERMGAVRIVVASDVDNPLCGVDGAAVVFGPQKGADEPTVARLEERLDRWSATIAAVIGRDVAQLPGAGAAGGLGAALLALGGQRVSGATVIAEAIGLVGLVAGSDLVITGEGKFDRQTLSGKVVAAVAGTARDHHVHTVVVAGQIALSSAEIAASGVHAAYAIVDVADSIDHAMTSAGELLQRLAAEIAGSWGPDP
ncbi:glycerate kinase [Williamsia sp. CHRR-6]|uniref:glycerate kinase family protein n=1 Tax=Williamsia sp. CHRR-6 TaxID=2835871 RepID=UPI001BDA11FC|nr:glycerate kinase [Williamsia sp. CHRR-6]MBT0565311.1 glycerate kinase [Williamsia sp. CHRR-6]